MNAVSELINNRRKSVKDVACLAAEGRLFQRTAPLEPKPFLGLTHEMHTDQPLIQTLSQEQILRVSHFASSETQGLLVGTIRYFRASDIFDAKVCFKS